MIDPSPARARRVIRAVAAAGILLVLVVLSMSALLRLRAAGLGCADWPACYGRADAGATVPSLARLMHRMSAMAATFAVVSIGVIAASRPRLFRRELASSVVMFVLLVGLAALGRSSAGAQSAAVPLFNVLGGTVLLALFARIATAGVQHDAHVPGWGPRLTRAGLFLLLVQIALGVLTSATFSGLACPGLVGCGNGSALRALPLASGPMLAPEAGAALHMLHRATALALLAVLLPLAWGLRRGHRALALLIVAAVLLQVALGVVMVAASLPLALAVAHNVGAALLVCVLSAAQHAVAPSARIDLG